jgi:hypothetical protein
MYLLLSCCPCEGRISGIVDVPNAVATLAIPTAIFDQDVRPKKGGPPVGPRLVTRGDVCKVSGWAGCRAGRSAAAHWWRAAVLQAAPCTAAENPAPPLVRCLPPCLQATYDGSLPRTVNMCMCAGHH